MEELIFKGKTEQEAITEASVSLGLQSEQFEYDIIQKGSNGFFGIGAKPYIIKIRLKSEGPEKTEKAEKVNNRKPEKEFRKDAEAKKDKQETVKKDQPKQKNKSNNSNNANSSNNANNAEKKQDAPQQKDNKNPRPNKKKFNKDQKSANETNAKENTEVKNNAPKAAKADNAEAHKTKPVHEKKYEKTGTVIGNPEKTAEEFLTGLFESMDMKISYKGVFNTENNELIVDLSGEDMGVLIGKRGQTLDALQYLTSQVVNKHQGTYIRVKLDTENYRERRKETMETLALNIAQKVKRTKKPVALEPMNPYERRIIHSVLQSDKEVITRSEGVEPYRHVVVCLARKKRSNNTANN